MGSVDVENPSTSLPEANLFHFGFPLLPRDSLVMEPTIFALGLACSQVLMLTLIIAKAIYGQIKEDPPPPESKLCTKESNNEKESKDGSRLGRRRKKASST